MSALPSHLEWYTSGRLAPYARSRKAFGTAIGMTECVQPAGDMSDPPVSDLVLVQTLTHGMRQSSDFGAGRFTTTSARNTFFLIPAGVATNIIVDNPHAIRTYGFASAHYRELLAEARPNVDPFDFGRLHVDCFGMPRALPVTDRLWRETTSESQGRLFADGAALIILGELCALADAKQRPLQGGLAPWAERRCCEYIREHLADDIPLADLAAIARLSPFHFARMFKLSTGLPPHAYQRRCRAEKAQELLVATDLSVTEIALAVGYDTPQAFARMFRAEVGASPSDWRREVRA